MRWFRMDVGIKDDPKLLALDDHQFRIWVCLAALAAEYNPRGTIPPCPIRGLAASLRTTEEAFAEALDAFEGLGLIDRGEDGSITITHGADYGKPSDQPDAARERKRRQRERERNGEITDGHADDTRDNGDGHAGVTPMSRESQADVTPMSRVTGREKEKGSPPDPLSQKKNSMPPTLMTFSHQSRPPSPDGDGGYPEEFERWWRVYPRKTGKRAAFDKWKARIREGYPPDDLLRAAEAYAEECRREGRPEKFIKHGATFLGPGRWFEDYLARASPGETGGGLLDWIPEVPFEGEGMGA